MEHSGHADTHRDRGCERGCTRKLDLCRKTLLRWNRHALPDIEPAIGIAVHRKLRNQRRGERARHHTVRSTGAVEIGQWDAEILLTSERENEHRALDVQDLCDVSDNAADSRGGQRWIYEEITVE